MEQERRKNNNNFFLVFVGFTSLPFLMTADDDVIKNDKYIN